MGDLDDMFDELEPVVAPVVIPPPALPEVGVDTVGVPFYLGSTTDSYGTGNPYVVALAIGSTPCFGTYEQGHPTCGVCPLSGSCRAQVYSLLGQIGVTLDAQDIDAIVAQLNRDGAPGNAPPTPVRTPAPQAQVPVNPNRTQPVATPAAPVADGGIEIPARADAKCYLCKGDIRKREMILFVPTKGMRHKACPTNTEKL